MSVFLSYYVSDVTFLPEEKHRVRFLIWLSCDRYMSKVNPQELWIENTQRHPEQQQRPGRCNTVNLIWFTVKYSLAHSPNDSYSVYLWHVCRARARVSVPHGLRTDCLEFDAHCWKLLASQICYIVGNLCFTGYFWTYWPFRFSVTTWSRNAEGVLQSCT